MLLSLEQGAASYGAKFVFRNLDLTAEPGECIGIIGPNGAGKTTLLRTFIGIQPLSAGKLLLLDQPLTAYSRKELAGIMAYLPQEQPASFAYRAGDVVLSGRYPHLSWYAREGEKERQLARKALAVMGLAGAEAVPLDQLSGGQRQRVFLARTLLQDARIFLLDEPASGLDFVYEEKAFQLCRLLTRLGRTIIVSVHDLTLAARFCTRLVLLGRQEFQCQGTPEQVLTADRLSRAYEVPVRTMGTGENFQLQLVPDPDSLRLQEQLLKDILQEA